MAYRQHLQHFMHYRKIMRVFVKHRLVPLAIRIGLGDLLGPGKGTETSDVGWENNRAMAERLCDAAIELGPTFVKMGQIMSTRPDFWPPVYINELEKLQDKVPPFSYEEVVCQLSRELGHPDEIFAEFDPNPLAAASIGQVHRARLKSGEEVIVKVQRPNIEKMMAKDLEVIIELARFAEWRSGLARRLGVVDMTREYARMIMAELDYDREARNTERMYREFAQDKRVIIPQIYWQYTTGRVLTEDYIEGVKLSDLDEITRRGWDRTKTSRLGTEAFLTQIIFHGFFQADPHPGNILVVDEDHIAFIDFGEVSSLSRNTLTNIGELMYSLVRRDIDMAIACLEEMGIIAEHQPLDIFREEFSELVETVAASKIGNVSMERVRNEFIDLAYRHRLKLPPYLTSLMKALITVEGVGKRLDPHFDFMAVASPMAQQVIRERMKPKNFYGFLRRKYYQDLRPLRKIPVNLNNLLYKTEQDQLKLNMEVSFSTGANRSIHKLIDRLSASLIIAGALISSAMIIQSGEGEWLISHANLGTIGFGISLLAMVLFIISFFRA